ncbi:MAG TPA: hypothetical protein VHM02_10260 [Thermoanaerobaculia bacterium]|nr:hypothetical protein [Thermoanaerobaculia bacterium]
MTCSSQLSGAKNQNSTLSSLRCGTLRAIPAVPWSVAHVAWTQNRSRCTAKPAVSPSVRSSSSPTA